jgi:hypothetical protein
VSVQAQWLRPANLANAWCIVALVVLGASSLHAQHAGATRRDPSDASAIVPPVIHARSPVVRADSSDEKRIPWKEANDEMGCIGGWRVYARESRDASSPTVVGPTRAQQAKTPPKTCSDHRDPRFIEREGRNDAR